MAIDLKSKRLAVATDLVQHATGLREVLFVLRSDADRAKTDSLVFLDSDFAERSDLAHLDAATVQALLDAIPTILAALKDGGYGLKIGAVAAK